MKWKTTNEAPELKKKIDEIAIQVQSIEPSGSIPGLMAGLSGVIIFLNYYYLFSGKEEYKNKADSLLEFCFENLNPDSFTLANGLTGLGWTVEHLSQNNFIDIDTNDVLSELDSILFSEMQKAFNEDNIDYLHGSLGHVLYFLARYNKTNNNLPLEFAIDKLMEISINGEDIKWQNKFNARDEESVDMGVAHGMASIIAIIAKYVKLYKSPQKLVKILDKAMLFYQNNKLAKDCLSVYPYQSSDIKINRPTRLAWCYGDLGIAGTLYTASEIIQSQKGLDEFMALAKHASKRRDLKENIVMDAGFCHGAAGNAHMFNRIYQKTNEPIFKETSNYWIEKALEMASFDDGIAGYKAWNNQDKRWENSFSLLDGVCGIGLVLISAASEIEPKWDEAFLLS